MLMKQHPKWGFGHERHGFYQGITDLGLIENRGYPILRQLSWEKWGF
jgi:hypothetical protein